MLELKGVNTFYGSVQALRGISFKVNEGNIVVLVGANGAGKTTTLLTISGSLRATQGSIKLFGQEISRLSPDEIVSLGCVQVPEGRRIFPNLTVEENLKVGASVRFRQGTKMYQIEEEIKQILKRFPNLEARRRQKGWSLSGGEQQMLAIGRGLMAKPKLLMLDEPSLGLSPKLVGEVFNLIREIRDQGTTVLLVEQNARAALRLADWAYVLQVGKIVHQGLAKDLLDDPYVTEAYLGGNVSL
jgi:branched-chain amino acid transport system ATP-binding protein